VTREEKLEERLRRWCVGLYNGRFHCNDCGGKWTRFENERGRERHVADCVLYRPERHAEATTPPAIPF
jgi:hypothetical protein